MPFGCCRCVKRERTGKSIGLLQANKSINYIEFNGNQFFSITWARNAGAILNNKKCAVIGALNHTVAAIQKLVFNPFKWNAKMRTCIFIDVNFVSRFYRKIFLIIYLKTFAAVVENIVDV